MSSIRFLWRDRTYSLLLTTGFTAALTSCILIGVYIRFQLSFDQFHKNVNLIAQVYQEYDSGIIVSTGMKMGPLLVENFPEYTDFTRIHYKGGLLRLQDSPSQPAYQEEGVAFVDTNFFSFFSFPLIAGHVKDVLQRPNSIVLSRQKAVSYFGSIEASLGKTVMLDDKMLCLVTGVCEDIPSNSSIQFSIAISISSLNEVYQSTSFESWWWPPMYTYLQLSAPNMFTSVSQARLNQFATTFREEGITIFPRIDRFVDIHVNGLAGGEGIHSTLWILGAIGAIILLIAIINYVNLVTARASIRAHEVGVRKSLGATRLDLFVQFMTEGWIVSLLSVALASVLAESLLPVSERLYHINMDAPWDNWQYWTLLLGVSILLAFVAGFYPVLILTSFSPVKAIKQQVAGSAKGSGFRKVLVGSQFVASLSLLSCTFVVWNQYQFLLSQGIGFQPERLISLAMEGDDVRAKLEPLMEELRKIPEIEELGGGSWSPAGGAYTMLPSEITSISGQIIPLENPAILYADSTFLKALGVEIKAGKILQDSLSKNVSTGFLVNEMLESKHSEVLGSDLRIYYGEYGRIIYEKKAEIVGVVKDFHIENLRTAVGPVVISLISEEERARQINHIMLRYREGAQEPVLAAIRDAWERVVGNYPIGLSFVDESIRKSYEEEETLGSLIGGFAIVAITLACLGLLGLVAFTTRQKTKEIGIRKTLGASQANILLLLGSEFASVLLLGTVISWLIAFYASKEWLSDYPYTAPSSFFSYLGSTAIGISMVMSIIAVLTIKESRKNPTDSLRQD